MCQCLAIVCLNELPVIAHHALSGTLLHLQIRSLVSLGLLNQAGVSDPLEAPKYKCLVSLDFIKKVAR